MKNQKDRFVCSKQDTNQTNSDREPVKNSARSSKGKPTAVWESPEFEEFDLCMEVTTYVHQWK